MIQLFYDIQHDDSKTKNNEQASKFFNILQKTKKNADESVSTAFNKAADEVTSLFSNNSDESIRQKEMKKSHAQEKFLNQMGESNKKSHDKGKVSGSKSNSDVPAAPQDDSPTAPNSSSIAGSSASQASSTASISPSDALNSNPSEMAMLVLGNAVKVNNDLLAGSFNDVQASNNKLENINDGQTNVRALQNQLPAASDSGADSKTVQMSPALLEQLKTLLPTTPGQPSIIPSDGKVNSSQLANISSALTGVSQTSSNQSDQSTTQFSDETEYIELRPYSTNQYTCRSE